MHAIRQVWRGEVSLAEAFWGWAVLGALLVNLFTSVLFLTLVSRDLTLLGFIAGYAISVPYNVLAAVGVWRAAARHPGDPAWAETARVIALVGLAVLTIT
jgi:hypothetical protein